MLTRSIPFKPERRANRFSSSTTTGSTMKAGTPDSFDSSNPMHAARLDACAPIAGSCRSPTIASSTRDVPEGSGRSSPPLQAIAERLATVTLWRVRKSLTIASRIGSWSMSETNWAIVAASCETVSVATGVRSSKIDIVELVEPGLMTRILNGKAASNILDAPTKEKGALNAPSRENCYLPIYQPTQPRTLTASPTRSTATMSAAILIVTLSALCLVYILYALSL